MPKAKKKERKENPGWANLTPGNPKHGGYKVLREVREGKFPDRRTALGRALDSFQMELESHFGGSFNGIQRVYFQTIMIPLFVYLYIANPIKEGSDEFLYDWKWSLSRLDNSYPRLVALGDGSGGKMESLEDYLVRVKEESMGGKKGK